MCIVSLFTRVSILHYIEVQTLVALSLSKRVYAICVKQVERTEKLHTASHAVLSSFKEVYTHSSPLT